VDRVDNGDGERLAVAYGEAIIRSGEDEEVEGIAAAGRITRNFLEAGRRTARLDELRSPDNIIVGSN